MTCNLRLFNRNNFIKRLNPNFLSISDRIIYRSVSTWHRANQEGNTLSFQKQFISISNFKPDLSQLSTLKEKNKNPDYSLIKFYSVTEIFALSALRNNRKALDTPTLFFFYILTKFFTSKIR